MLDEAFNCVYTKFKLHFYRSIFGRFQTREASLTTVETFCMEIINALGHPTINEFYNISQRYLTTVLDRVKERFSEEDVTKLEEMLKVISEELMPELDPGIPLQSHPAS